MIRVLHVIGSLRYSSAARQLALLAARLARDEFELRVVALEHSHRPTGVEPELREAGVGVSTLGRRLGLDPAALWRLRGALSEFRPHIVHAWEGAAHNYARLALGAGKNRRLVATRTRFRSMGGVERWIEQRLAERTAWLIVPSGGLAEACGPAGFERVTVIPWGVEVSPQQPFDGRAELAAFDIGDNVRVAGYIGELTRERRGRDLIWGINLLSQLTSRVCLLAVGEGPERESLLSFARQIERDEFVRFPGEVDGRRAMRLFDLYWSVGEEEAPSCALLESMAAGIPAIVSDTPAHRELVVDGETGYFVKVGDGVGIAQFSDRLLADPDRRRQMGDAARARAREEFPAQKMVAAHADLYRALSAEVGG